MSSPIGRNALEYIDSLLTPEEIAESDRLVAAMLKQIEDRQKAKRAYPIVLTPSKQGYVVYVPDFDINTQGKDVADAIYMARDAIGIIGIDMQDEGEPFPTPSPLSDVLSAHGDIVIMVDVDFDEYRRDQETLRERLEV